MATQPTACPAARACQPATATASPGAAWPGWRRARGRDAPARSRAGCRQCPAALWGATWTPSSQRTALRTARARPTWKCRPSRSGWTRTGRRASSVWWALVLPAPCLRRLGPRPSVSCGALTARQQHWLLLLQARRQEALSVPAERLSGSAEDLTAPVKPAAQPAEPLSDSSSSRSSRRSSAADVGQAAPGQAAPSPGTPGVTERAAPGASQEAAQHQRQAPAPDAGEGATGVQPGPAAPGGHVQPSRNPEPAPAAQDCEGALQPSGEERGVAHQAGEAPAGMAGQPVAAQPAGLVEQAAAAAALDGLQLDSTQPVSPAADEQAGVPQQAASAHADGLPELWCPASSGLDSPQPAARPAAWPAVPLDQLQVSSGTPLPVRAATDPATG